MHPHDVSSLLKQEPKPTERQLRFLQDIDAAFADEWGEHGLSVLGVTREVYRPTPQAQLPGSNLALRFGYVSADWARKHLDAIAGRVRAAAPYAEQFARHEGRTAEGYGGDRGARRQVAIALVFRLDDGSYATFSGTHLNA